MFKKELVHLDGSKTAEKVVPYIIHVSQAY